MATRPPRLKAKPMAGRWQAGIRKQSFWLDIRLIAFSFWISFRGKPQWNITSPASQARRGGLGHERAGISQEKDSTG